MNKSKDAHADKRKPKAMVGLVRLSMKLARMHLSPFGSSKSRHDFTQPQLMTCPVLRVLEDDVPRGDRAAGGQR